VSPLAALAIRHDFLSFWGAPPPIFFSKNLAGRGFCKMRVRKICLPKELELKYMKHGTYARFLPGWHSVSASTMMKWFWGERKVRCHRGAVEVSRVPWCVPAALESTASYPACTGMTIWLVIGV
jgi:hypothetical protein